MRAILVGEEGERDRRRQPGEHGLRAGPVCLQQGPELVAGRGAGPHMVLAQPHQGLQLPGGRIHRLQPPQPMAIGG